MRRVIDDEGPLDEQYVQDAFHSYLKSSLAQASLDIEVLSSAEGDLMITDVSHSHSLVSSFTYRLQGPHYVSSSQHCAPRPTRPRYPSHVAVAPKSLEVRTTTLVPVMRLWSDLAPKRQHDLARVICNLAPLEKLAPPPRGGDFRAIAIAISQRCSFQDRYASDLQAAIDVGESPGGPGSLLTKASFRSPVLRATPPPIPSLLLPHSPLSATASIADPRRSPTIAGPTSPAIELIRETLYAALADVLASTPRLNAQLTRDPPRTYYGAVALAILAVSARSVAADGDDGGAVWLSRSALRRSPLMREFVAIGVEAALIEEEDTAAAIALAQEGRTVPVPRIERARVILERRAGYDIPEREERDSGGGRSAEGRAVAFANRVNVLALSMTRLPQFRERQVFRVLAAVAGGH
ncbi:hypothetical protein EDB89DRAFT_2114921 [Lactarius sanguifluus]|nr:hypothetical protein EDB89DRAFT_2114921 [Lactarius sanguifluus]